MPSSGISVQIQTTRDYTDGPYPIRTPPSTEAFGRVSPYPGSVERIDRIVVTDVRPLFLLDHRLACSHGPQDESDVTIETHHV